MQSTRTVDTTALAAQTGNLYESVAVVAKRARQISAQVKDELDQKLSYFEDLSLDPAEELRSNEDQLRISLDYERRPKPTLLATEQFEAGALYHRIPTEEERAAMADPDAPEMAALNRKLG